MSNDYSVAQAAIDSINRIDDVCYESGINITNALMDNYSKEMEMRLYGEQYFGESWLDKTDDESIIKTIFFAVPRFIRHLVRLIKKRWENFKLNVLTNPKEIDATEEDLAKALEELKRAEQLEAEAKAEYERWLHFFDNIPHIKFNNDEGKFYYYSDIKSFEDLKEYYQQMLAFFAQYEEGCRDFNGSLEVFNKFHYGFKRIADSTLFAQVDSQEYELSPEFRNFIINFSEFEEKTIDQIDKYMSNVNSWYTKYINDATNVSKQRDKDRAKQIFDDIRKIRDDLLEVDTKVFKSLSEAKSSFMMLNNRIKERNRILGEKNKNELFSDNDNDEE